VQEVNLPQVRLSGVGGNPGAMLHRPSGVRVTFNAEAGNQVYRRGWHLAEEMPWIFGLMQWVMMRP
jgi:hypothetical protein